MSLSAFLSQSFCNTEIGSSCVDPLYSESTIACLVCSLSFITRSAIQALQECSRPFQSLQQSIVKFLYSKTFFLCHMGSLAP